MPTATRDEVAERARKAVIAFRRELPLLRAFVRAVGRDNRLNVEIVSSGPPRTDGKVVKMAVPIKLGDRVEHIRTLGGSRDEDGVLVCPACSHREEIFITLCHETGHILHGSFQAPDMDVIREFVSEFY